VNKNTIEEIRAREVLDSRGMPTVQADVILDGGLLGRATAPAGASRGKREALELRDGDDKRYFGIGVLSAVRNIRGEIARALVGEDPTRQEEIDKLLIELDGSGNKGRLGANAIDIPYRAPDSSRPLQQTHRPYWVTHNWDTLISPFPKGWIDNFLPADMRRRRIGNKLREDIETLVVHNVENIRWATLRNLDDAFRFFSAELDERLKQTVETTRGGIDAAHKRRKRQEETVQPELQRLKRSEAKLAPVSEALAEFTLPAETNG
jgi:enolase-like protein